MYQILNKNNDIPTGKITWNKIYHIEESEWKAIYTFPYRVTSYPALRWFQISINNNVLVTNKLLQQMRIKNDGLCTFCQSSNESIIHLFWQCQMTQNFIKSVVAWLSTYAWVKVPRNENPEKGRGSWGPPRPPCGSRAKPWWGIRGRSPRKLLDFSNLNTPKTAQKLRKHKGKLTTFFLDIMSVIYFFFSYPSNRLFFFTILSKALHDKTENEKAKLKLIGMYHYNIYVKVLCFYNN